MLSGMSPATAAAKGMLINLLNQHGLRQV